LVKKKDRELFINALFLFCFASLVFWGTGQFRHSIFVFAQTTWLMFAMVSGLTAVLIRKMK